MLVPRDLTITLPMRRAVTPVAVGSLGERGELGMPAQVGPFELGRFLGAGGMGVVFEARHAVLDRRVALKLIRPDVQVADKARARFLREAQALARIAHPNVVTLFELGAGAGETYLAMELAAGGTVREWMSTPRAWRDVVAVFVGVGRGLAEAHRRGLVHRDVNPSNLFLAADGTPKLGDFGLVSIDGDDDRAGDGAMIAPRAHTRTTTGSVLGTPAYMAPEQRRGDRVDAKVDQYAFCASLHEALTGGLPDEDGAPPLPAPIRAIVARGLAHDPDDRFPSMDALLAAMAR